jgi:predicted NUDIX family NTP pyrophosphohydrolase
MEWPPKSGKLKEFPEADKAAWLDVNEARRKILKGQLPIIEALVMIFGDR